MYFVKMFAIGMLAACFLWEVRCYTKISNQRHRPYRYSAGDPQAQALQRRIDQLHKTINELHRHRIQRARQQITLPPVIIPVIPTSRKSAIPLLDISLTDEPARHHHLESSNGQYNNLRQFYYPKTHPFPSYPYLTADEDVPQTEEYWM